MLDDSGLVLKATNGSTAGSFTGWYPPTFSGAVGYTVSGKSIIATDVRTGNLRWSRFLKESPALPPIVVNGNIYTLSPSGTLYVNSSIKGRPIQTIPIGLGGLSGQQDQVGLWFPYFTGLGAGAGKLLVPSGTLLTAFVPVS